MSDEENTVLPAQDPKAYRKPVAYNFPWPRPGGLPGDREITASPYLIKALRDREWIEKDRKK